MLYLQAAFQSKGSNYSIKMVVTTLDIICIITSFQLLLLGYILITQKKGKKISHSLLSAFMLANFFLIFSFLNGRIKLISKEDFRVGAVLLKSCYYLLIPLLYLYIKSVCYRTFRLRPRELFHLAPYISAVIWSLIQNHDQYPVLRVFFSWLLHIQVAGYTIIILRTFYSYRLDIKAMYASVKKIDLSWLLFLFLGFVLMWLMDFTNFLLGWLHIKTASVGNLLLFLSLAINFIFATGIVYCGLKQLAVFSGIEEKPKYATSTLSPQEYEKLLQHLTEYMEKSKPYLNPELSLNDLALQLAILPRYLSQVINQSTNRNFFDFINRYRIDEFKHRIINAGDTKTTILEVLYDVGFNSKSTFNEAFKKHTGITPTEFIRTHRA